MKFGYFTLSDNAYPDLGRSAEQFILEIGGQALHAEKIGLNSAWIGEHSFDSLGVNFLPACVAGSGRGAIEAHSPGAMACVHRRQWSRW